MTSSKRESLRECELPTTNYTLPAPEKRRDQPNNHPPYPQIPNRTGAHPINGSANPRSDVVKYAARPNPNLVASAHFASDPGRADERTLRTNGNVAFAAAQPGRLSLVPIAVEDARFPGNWDRSFTGNKFPAAGAAEGLLGRIFSAARFAAGESVHRTILIQHFRTRHCPWAVNSASTSHVRATALGQSPTAATRHVAAGECFHRSIFIQHLRTCHCPWAAPSASTSHVRATALGQCPRQPPGTLQRGNVSTAAFLFNICERATALGQCLRHPPCESRTHCPRAVARLA